ncbi:class I SAM-dependent methyltransferase [Paenibacillus arenilitoris]|uniref:Methylase n=1 Tax=Paenibacillus arenilitoris TaxID=2772299 RepID=A0A927CSQ8_9BACL|nr:class I SAM-dependent methyltransferase [Paenibacillus arenilitoris]MBD2872967.1 methylase [Paenibacillus arenilitoris]
MNKAGYEQIGVAMTCRGYEEYVRMFDLTDEALRQGKVLDVAAGASSFTAEANERGFEAEAVDPRYGTRHADWVAEAEREIDYSTAKLGRIADSFDWSYYGSLENHRKGREASLGRFAADVAEVKRTHRYKQGFLPELPFEDNRYSLILCSHFLFLYAAQFGAEFHRLSVLELMRICKPGGQIRIYPLLSLNWEPYPELDALLESIEAAGGRAELLPSRLPFIPGSDQFLRILP